jgi:hypothetical protein
MQGGIKREGLGIDFGVYGPSDILLTVCENTETLL